MRILICDDTQKELDITRAYVSEYFKKKNMNIKIECFTDSNVVLNHLNFLDDIPYDLYLLDVVMQQNGINVAKEIIKKVPNAQIIFTTSSKDYAIEAFKVQAFDYIVKPIDKTEFFDSITRILKNIKLKKILGILKQMICH